jgi:hypothetical protein
MFFAGQKSKPMRAVNRIDHHNSNIHIFGHTIKKPHGDGNIVMNGQRTWAEVAAQ